MAKVKLLIVHPNTAVREALTTRLGASHRIEVVGNVETVTDGLALQQQVHADEVLLGIPGRKHTQLDPMTAFIHEMSDQGVPVVVLAAYMNDVTHHTLLEAGASRYLLKDINTPQLINELVDASSVSFM